MGMIKIYHRNDETFLQSDDQTVRVASFAFDELFTAEDPEVLVRSIFDQGEPVATLESSFVADTPWLPPIGRQEVWAAGVTYYRSRSARMEESEKSGGDQFYDLVYEAKRPELFFKATGSRTRGHLAPVRIRDDSDWDVPEPELTLAFNREGKLFGFSIGNDMSSRSIEGENPLYLPQAKVYRGSCAIGPCLVVGNAVSRETTIEIEILREGTLAFSGTTTVAQIKRSFDELAQFLFRENEFPNGVYLMTGTGIVPDSDFTLTSGDRIRISIGNIGTLDNTVE